MKRLWLATMISVLGAMPAQSAVLVFKATLDGLQEVPANLSPGTGTGTVIVDTATNKMRVITSFSGLTGNVTVAHIHCCTPPGANAQVATPVPTFTGFPSGVTAGSYNRLFDMTVASSFNPAFVNNAANGGNLATARQTLFNGFAAGTTYLNIHTNLFPGGEIRGQLVAFVPEPKSWALMIAGFGLAGAAARARRRSALAA